MYSVTQLLYRQNMKLPQWATIFCLTVCCMILGLAITTQNIGFIVVAAVVATGPVIMLVLDYSAANRKK